MNPQLLRQRHNVVAALEPLHRHPTELLGMPSRSFLGHLQSPFPAKCASSVCLKIGVHSTEVCATKTRIASKSDAINQTNTQYSFARKTGQSIYADRPRSKQGDEFLVGWKKIVAG